VNSLPISNTIERNIVTLCAVDIRIVEQRASHSSSFRIHKTIVRPDGRQEEIPCNEASENLYII